MAVDIIRLAGFLVDRIGGSDSRDNVFTLRIGQPFAVEFVFAGGRIAGKRNTGGGIFAHVAENHRLHVDCCAPVIGNAFYPAVRNGALAVPALENRADRAPQLFHGIIRKRFAQHFLDFGLVNFSQLGQIFVRQIDIQLDIPAFFHRSHFPFQLLTDAHSLFRLDSFGFFHHDIRIHLNQTTVRIQNETGIVGFFDHAGNRL